MLKIGLTGGIGSGKTTISKIFAGLGTPVIDADVIARTILEPGHPAFDETIKAFGREILDETGRINRQQLRLYVFNNPRELKRLEAILHPYVRQEIRQQLESLDAPYCLVVIPLLIETQQTDLVDRILVIHADEKTCLKRVIKRDQITAEEAKKIMLAQVSQKTRLAHADDVIDNSGNLATLKDAVARLHQQYLDLARNN